MEYYELKLRIPRPLIRLIQFRLTTILLLIAMLAIALAWYRDHKQLAAALRRYRGPTTTNWNAIQATGAPNTTGPGDIMTAWASATPDESKEWLDLKFDQSVVPSAILVHESFNPGAVTKVTHVSIWGTETTLWEGQDPTAPTAGAGTSRLPVTAGFRTGHIKLYVDSPSVPGFNEIDAVGLEYGNNQVLWAAQATASTEWGTAWQGGVYPEMVY